MMLSICVAPCRQLEPAVVGRVYQTGFGQGSTEEGQLPQAYGPGLALYPSAGKSQYG
jgi:hypothetical protein